MNPYLDFVSQFSRIMKQGQTLPLGNLPALPRPALPEDAPKALIFSPHPDDECIIGGFALRLMRQNGMRVINVAVTHGSRRDRKQARLLELKGACDFIGFDLIQTGENGMDNINANTREQNPGVWLPAVTRICEIIEAQKPEVIFLPHDDDFNTTHIGTHLLVVDALRKLGNVSCWAIETEFWSPMKEPNLMVESPGEDVAELLAALSFHAGEVERNSYHLRMPSWLIDNVRRGGEVIGGQGGTAPDFLFATLYRLSRWENDDFERMIVKAKTLPADEKPGTLFTV